MARTRKLIDESEILDEDSVSNNVDTSPMDGMSKTNALSLMMKGVATADNWEEIFQNVMAQVGQHSAAIPDDSASKNAASTAMKGAIKEDLVTIFGDSKELSEEFKTKALTLFESAVGARVALIESELEEAYEARLEEELEEIQGALVDQIDEYLSFTVEQWLEENKIAIERSVRSELAEEFIQNLGQLFIEHNFNIPEEQVEVVDMMAEKLDEVEEAYNSTLLENIELTKLLEELTKKDIIKDLSENLTQVEAERFKLLVEDIDLNDVDEYEAKLAVIKEHHFNKKTAPRSTQLINEEISYSEEDANKELNSGQQNVPNEMSGFLEALNRTRKTY